MRCKSHSEVVARMLYHRARNRQPGVQHEANALCKIRARVRYTSLQDAGPNVPRYRYQNKEPRRKWSMKLLVVGEGFVVPT